MSNTKEKTDMFDPTQGLEELLSMPEVIQTNTGEDVQIPRANWGMELQVIRSVGKLLGNLRDELNLTWDGVKELMAGNDREKLFSLLVKVAELAPDEITKMVATIIGKDEDFVRDSLELGTIIKVLIPFLSQRMEQLAQSIAPMGKDLGASTQQIQASLSTAKVKNPH